MHIYKYDTVCMHGQELAVLWDVENLREAEVLRREALVERERVRAVDGAVGGAVDEQHGRRDALDALDVGERVTERVHAYGRAAAADGAEARRRRDEEAQTG